MLSTVVDISEAAEAVRSFNALYAEMDKVLWRLSRAARASLLSGERTDVLAELVWTVRSWWGIQGVRSEVKTLGARALAKIAWSQEFLQEPETADPSNSEEFALERVTSLVRIMVQLGARRMEFSLASKVLHWLFPWHIPVYDSFVRSTLQIPGSWSHEAAYREIVDWEFTVSRQLMTQASEWIGEVDPKSPLRALDKYLWWKGGGDSGRAVVVRDPWRVVYRLGLPRDSPESMLDSIDSLRDGGWEGFVTIDLLRRPKLAAVPEEKGVYLVLRAEHTAPIFLKRSPAGHFKGEDPTVPIQDLESNWIDGALVLYIGKAGKDGQASTLKSRLNQYLAFGAGRPVAHRGGKLIWQLAGAESLLVCWKALPSEDPREVERGLIAAFRNQHGNRRPFANLQD